MAITRISHVWRQFAEDNEGVYLDIRRTDKFKTTHRIPDNHGFQGLIHTYQWDDEENPFDHPTRTQEEVRVENPNDEDVFVTVPGVLKVKTHAVPSQNDVNNQATTFKFLNEEIESKKVEFRRVYGAPLLSNDPPISFDEYVRDEDNRTGDYVDVAVYLEIKTTSGQKNTFQEKTYTFDTDYMMSISEPSPEDVDPETIVWLDPLQEIVNVKWESEPSPYIVVNFDFVTRRNKTSQQIEAIGGSPLTDPSLIVETLVQYQSQGLWPFGYLGGLHFTEPPPEAEFPDNWEGVPPLPQVSDFGAGLVCADYSQAVIRPGSRWSETSGGHSGIYPGVPEPPDIPGATTDWGPPAVQLEIYQVDVPSHVGGATLASLDLDFSGMTITEGQWIYAAINCMKQPKEEGSIVHNPPFIGPPYTENSNLQAGRLHVLLQITNPPPGYDPD